MEHDIVTEVLSVNVAVPLILGAAHVCVLLDSEDELLLSSELLLSITHDTAINNINAANTAAIFFTKVIYTPILYYIKQTRLADASLVCLRLRFYQADIWFVPIGVDLLSPDIQLSLPPSRINAFQEIVTPPVTPGIIAYQL